MDGDFLIERAESELLPKVQKTNLSTQLVEALASMVEAGTWKPGDKLPNEIELAASFNVSRNIMREAMKILINFGILDSNAGSGTFVSSSAISGIHSMRFFERLKKNTSLEKIMETRLIIEPELAYLACLRGTDEEIRALEALVNKSEKIWRARNYFYTDDFNFHAELARMSKNDILSDLLSTMLNQLKEGDYIQFNRYTKPEERDSRVDEHGLIVEAIKKRDALLAKSIMHRHLFGRIEVINSSYDTEELCKEIESSQTEQDS